MPRKPTQITEPEVDAAVPYEFEVLSERVTEQLRIWGNCTQTTITNIYEEAPGWASMLNDIFNVVKEAVKENSK